MDFPARLFDFELLELLGEGGSGAVYAARRGDGDVVALKVLREDLGLSSRERGRFLDEAARVRRVDHPNVVSVLEAGTFADGVPFLTMPRLRGETLAARVARGPIGRADALAWVLQIAAGLAEMHDAGLVHRDVKPENVFVTDEGQAVLLDLGIARDATAPRSTTTEEGKTRGTPAYMAPERFFGSPADVRTDIYELAVVLYLALVGELPWSEGAGAAGRLHPAAPETRGVVLPPALVTTVLAALSTLPEKRPASVRAFADAVRAAAEAASAETAAPSVTRTTEKVALATPPSPPDDGRSVTDTRRRGISRAWWALGAVPAAAVLVANLGAPRAPRDEPPTASLTPTSPIPSPTPPLVDASQSLPPLSLPRPNAPPPRAPKPTPNPTPNTTPNTTPPPPPDARSLYLDRQ